jgi:hypothetical protein
MFNEIWGETQFKINDFVIIIAVDEQNPQVFEKHIDDSMWEEMKDIMVNSKVDYDAVKGQILHGQNPNA